MQLGESDLFEALEFVRSIYRRLGEYSGDDVVASSREITEEVSSLFIRLRKAVDDREYGDYLCLGRDLQRGVEKLINDKDLTYALYTPKEWVALQTRVRQIRLKRKKENQVGALVAIEIVDIVKRDIRRSMDGNDFRTVSQFIAHLLEEAGYDSNFIS